MTSSAASELAIVDTPTGWKLSGELDAHTAPQILDRLTTLPGGEATLDMSELAFVDSSGLRALLQLLKYTRDAGGDAVLIRPTTSVRRLIAISGLNDHVKIRSQ